MATRAAWEPGKIVGGLVQPSRCVMAVDNLRLRSPDPVGPATAAAYEDVGPFNGVLAKRRGEKWKGPASVGSQT